MSDLGLVVPIRLEALLIGERDANEDNYFLPPFANFTTLPYAGSGLNTPFLSSLVLNRPFNGQHPMRKGIHLHWNLPRALRRGEFLADDRLSLPHVPDRWLVTRVLADLTDPTQPVTTLKSWVVESNYVADDATYSSTSIPNAPTAPKPWRYLGRVYDYADWVANGNQGTYLSDLTAMGFGIPDFSSYYPDCVNVFGFADTTLDGYDPATSALAYLVTGWYANDADDPLHGRSIDGTDNPFGWHFTNDPDGETPAYSLYHGVIYDVRWDPPIAFLPGYDTKIAPDIAVGNTPMEGFSALAAAKLRNQPLQHVERTLNALQLGVLKELGQPDGLGLLEDAIYNKSYGAGSGGTLWVVRPKRETDGEVEPAVPGPRGTPPRARGVNAIAAMPGGVADLIEELNAQQLAIDEARELAASVRAQIFADWQKFMKRLHPRATEEPTPDEIFNYIKSAIATADGIDGEDGTVAGLNVRVERLKAEIAGALPDDLELAETAAPRFYRPNDPVLVLSGDGVAAPPADNAETIACLLTTQLASAMQLPAGLVSGSEAIALDASALPRLDDTSKLPHPAIAALVQNTLLLDPQSSGIVAAAVAALGGSANPAVLDFTATNDAIVAAQGAFLARTPGNGITFTGDAPEASIAFRAWQEPWNPIALSWSFDLRPVLDTGTTSYPSTFVTDTFTFDPAAMNFELQDGVAFGRPQPYSGTVLLSPDASISVQREIRQYLEYVDDPELRTILNDLGDVPLLAQAVGGFHSALVMLEETMQLPVADPIAPTSIFSTFSNGTVPKAVRTFNRIAPLTTNAYNPLRAGKITFQRIILIDEFGRFREVALENLLVSETIPVVPATQPPELLPPLRVAQGTQLMFRWLSASNSDNETASGVPETNPICGWVVPSHLDESLMFYDATGAAIGTLSRARGAGRPFVWQDAPGTGSPGGTMEQAFAGQNAVLAAFATSVVANGGEYLTALIRTIDRTRTFIAPGNYQEDRQTAVLLGTPLAITQATLDLDLLGMAAPDQSIDALLADLSGGDPLGRTTRGFTRVRFPVVLGSLERLNDGLIGYFLDKSGAPDFATLYAAQADGEDAHIVEPTVGTIALDASYGTAPTRVTMLIDPRCGVHAFTGIAPVKRVDVPPELYAVALANMIFTFLTAPVLRTSDRFAIPIPAEGNGDWSWVGLEANQWTGRNIEQLNASAILQPASAIVEGWLQLTPKKGT